jgi:hypothetical protein
MLKPKEKKTKHISFVVMIDVAFQCWLMGREKVKGVNWLIIILKIKQSSVLFRFPFWIYQVLNVVFSLSSRSALGRGIVFLKSIFCFVLFFDLLLSG